jgi:hypothetical protein
MLSKGIVRSVYIAYLPTQSAPPALITAVVTEVMYIGEYPSAPLTEDTKGDFEVRVRLHISSHAAWSGSVEVTGFWLPKATTKVVSPVMSMQQGDSNVTVVITAPKKDINLWWPVGMGDRPMYNVSARLVAKAGGASASAVRRIGFRVFAIVTGNDTDAAWVAASTGADGTADPPLGMRFRVNGAAIFARGGNLVPLDVLEARNTAASHAALVRSVAEGGMNIMRIWGGGVYQLDSFYNAADEYGVLLYHDIQFAQQGHGPAVTATQASELRYQIRRLSNHPSIILYDGCNECLVKAGPDIYADFVLTTVASEDASRVVWPSSPGDGWKSGVDRLYGLPNGKKLISSGTHDKIEVHGPYNWASSKWPAVNGDNSLPPTGLHAAGESHCTTGAIGCRGWGAQYTHIPLTNLSKVESGLGLRNAFSSEGGTVVMSSFESMSPTLAKEHWSLHGGALPADCSTGGSFGPKLCHRKGEVPTPRNVDYNVMSERNYACDDLILTFFGNASVAALDEVGEMPFKRQLYQCQLAQALLMTQTHSVMRLKNRAPAYPQSSYAGNIAYTQNTFGIIVWMLNEIWPTGGWGSLEYSQAAVGSVLGGRWKPLHYFFRRTIFTDQFAACGLATDGVPTAGITELLCGVVNDSPWAFDGAFKLEAVDLTTGASTTMHTQALTMAAGAGVSEWHTVAAPPKLDVATTVLVATVSNSSGHTVQENLIPLTSPELMQLPDATVNVSVSGLRVTVTTDRPAMWVMLTTAAHGRFEDNAFLLAKVSYKPPTRTSHCVSLWVVRIITLTLVLPGGEGRPHARVRGLHGRPGGEFEQHNPGGARGAARSLARKR